MVHGGGLIPRPPYLEPARGQLQRGKSAAQGAGVLRDALGVAGQAEVDDQTAEQEEGYGQDAHHDGDGAGLVPPPLGKPHHEHQFQFAPGGLGTADAGPGRG